MRADSRDLGDYSKSPRIPGPTQLLWDPLLCLNRGSDGQHFPAQGIDLDRFLGRSRAWFLDKFSIIY